MRSVRESVPGIAARLHDGFRVRPELEGEEALPEEQPDALDGIAFGSVRWLVEQRHIVGHGQGSGGVPAGAVENHEGVLVLGQGFGEVLQEAIHRLGRDRRQDQRKGLSGGGLGGGEDIGPVEPLIAQPGRALSLQPPAMTQAPLLADARLVLKEQADPLGRMGCGDFLQAVAEPLF